MAFGSVPRESRNQINKAGAILVLQSPPEGDLAWAIDLADRWRACHAYPINTFQATLRTKLGAYSGDPIAAQRLKRMPTIIDKLKRYPAMKLTTMQDIGGVRAILGSVKDVRKLVSEYHDSKRLAHELVDLKDYIQNPRDEDGYRSVHLIYKYRNKHAPKYDGLRIEMQVRSRLQHVWATAVESMGTFLGQALKSRLGDRAWLDFFALISAVFSHDERCPCIPRYAHSSRKELSVAVADAERHLHALNMMRGLSVAANAIYTARGSGKGSFYHLIILNSLKRTVRVMPYDRDSFPQALAEYSRVEAEAAKGEQIEPVLVSAGPMEKLRRAYPNFFLDINDFTHKASAICAESTT